MLHEIFTCMVANAKSVELKPVWSLSLFGIVALLDLKKLIVFTMPTWLHSSKLKIARPTQEPPTCKTFKIGIDSGFDHV